MFLLSSIILIYRKKEQPRTNLLEGNLKYFHEQIGDFFKLNDFFQVFTWEKERKRYHWIVSLFHCLGTAIEEREKDPCEFTILEFEEFGTVGNQVGVIVLPKVKEKKTYLILTKFTKVKYFLICVKVSKRHTIWDGGSI